MTTYQTNQYTGLPDISIGGTVPVASGGTGKTIFTQGDIVFSDATGSLAGLAKCAGGIINYLSNQGVNNAPLWSKVDLANGVTGNLSPANLNNGSGADGTTFWRGDGTWALPPAGGTLTVCCGNAVCSIDFVGMTYQTYGFVVGVTLS